MIKSYAIFDMDGTLVDSMGSWISLGYLFLESQHIKAPENIQQIVAPMTLMQAAEYFQSLGATLSPAEIVDKENEIMMEQYRTKVTLKPHIEEYLKLLKEAGIPCCVATGTAKPLAEECLQRLGILSYFEFVLSCEDIGVGKRAPDVYYQAAQRFGASPAQCSVFEDSAFAMNTAAKAGFDPIGVYDAVSGEKNAAALEQIARRVIRDYHEEALALRDSLRQ